MIKVENPTKGNNYHIAQSIATLENLLANLPACVRLVKITYPPAMKNPRNPTISHKNDPYEEHTLSATGMYSIRTTEPQTQQHLKPKTSKIIANQFHHHQQPVTGYPTKPRSYANVTECH